MIYVTGDVHGLPSSMRRFNTRNFPQQKNMTKDDYVIVVGDFGWVWYGEENNAEEKYWLRWLNEKPWTTIWVDGNHENHFLLDNMPVEEWNGGKVHKVKDSIYHLMRGQVFNLQGKKFFTFGGAASHDKEHRKEWINWWAREMPSYAEYEEGLNNLDKNECIVDFVLTHTCSESTLQTLADNYGMRYDVDVMHEYFEEIQTKLQYQKWFFGHFHKNLNLPNKQILIYEQMIRIL
ncbi:metallophosphoesterase family protein [Paenibacillus sp. GCM10027627]|uniref:metallophosphoesterase family protein n=1 Tax=unclassified Paenibacillus TaxID=185978 RepID=UPI00362D0359